MESGDFNAEFILELFEEALDAAVDLGYSQCQYVNNSEIEERAYTAAVEKMYNALKGLGVSHADSK